MYKIKFTLSAIQDLQDTFDYIEKVIKSPASANNLLSLAETRIKSLENNPYIHAMVDDPVLSSWCIRFITVNNYLAFYTIDEKLKTIYIIRFLYGRRDWLEILKQSLE